MNPRSESGSCSSAIFEPMRSEHFLRRAQHYRQLAKLARSKRAAEQLVEISRHFVRLAYDVRAIEQGGHHVIEQVLRISNKPSPVDRLRWRFGWIEKFGFNLKARYQSARHRMCKHFYRADVTFWSADANSKTRSAPNESSMPLSRSPRTHFVGKWRAGGPLRSSF